MKMQQKLSPQQLLLLQLIQMPVTELEQRLKEEVEKNPVLEVSGVNEMIEPLPESSNEGPDMMSVDTDDDDYSYRERQERDKNQDAHERVFVAINAASEPYTFHFDAQCGRAVDLITGKDHDFGAGSEVEPFSAHFWLCER